MDKSILYPMFALAFWTFAILLLVPIVRFKAVFARQAKAEDFKLGETENLPEYVRLPNRNYMNLLELPVLFYVICIIIFVTNCANQLNLYLAWGYFALRIIHSLIHLNGNNVRLRLIAFGLSNVTLIALWVSVLIKLS